jgi:hypothetical protein
MLFKCSPCCRCNVCEYSQHDCLTLTLAGFSGNPADGTCEECDYLDGTYILKRGLQAAGLTARIDATAGSGAQVSATLSQDAETGKYTISSVTLLAGGSAYTPDAHFGYAISNALLSPCSERCAEQ